MSAGRVVFLTGAPGVGKSTVGRLLADRLERAFFLDLDAFRTWS
jgi:shikimate kinase